jgi:hypothetical protein
MAAEPERLVVANGETLRVAYTEVCSSYHAITDLRSKLLALLPIASGTGVVLLLTKQKEPLETNHVWAIGLFGFLATLGLFFYELRGIQRCKVLISLGAALEAELGLKTGQFSNQPSRWLGFIGAESAGWMVYGATLMAWLYVVIVGISKGGAG